MGNNKSLTDQHAVERLLEHATTYPLRGRGTVLFNQGQPVIESYLVLSGNLKLVHLHEDGQEVITDVLSPVSIIGEFRSCTKTHDYSAVTATDTAEVASIPSDRVEQIAFEDECVLSWVLRQQEARLAAAYNLLSLRQLPVADRVPRMLRHLVDQLPGDALGAVDLPLSARELAQFVQTAPESLSRALRKLRLDGVLERSGRKLKVDLGTLVNSGMGWGVLAILEILQ